MSENLDAGPQGVGVQQDHTYTLEARNKVQAVAFDMRGREGGAQFEGPHSTANIRAASGGSSKSYVAQTLAPNPETVYGVNHASTQKTDADQALRALREAVGAEAFAQWGLGILDTLQSSKILRPEVHGQSVRCASDDRNKLDDDALSCEENRPQGAVLALWQVGCVGCPPRGWQPPEQHAIELVAHLSQLPQQRTQAERFMLDLWRASEGIGLLREALSALQKAWRPNVDQAESAHSTWAVRRLTPLECERLMGLPEGHTAIARRGKPAADGPRYKAIGNSMAVNVMRWIGTRIQWADEAAGGVE